MKTDYLTTSFTALREKLHRSALRFLRNEEDAGDALQDTFLKLWSGREISSDTEARNKLFAVLRNVCIDRLRAPQCLPLEDSDAMLRETTPEADDSAATLERLITAILSERQALVFRLVTHDGLEYEEVADRLGMTAEAVRMNMSRARRKIRDNYKKLNDI